MRNTLLILFSAFLLLFHLTVHAASDTLKHYKAVRIHEKLKIDGILDEPSWQEAHTISDFVMFRPTEGGTPTQRTEVKIVYDNSAIYVGAILYDSSPDSILRELGLRDGADPASESGFSDINADYFLFAIDPYNKRQDGYYFGVYASGVQADSRISDELFDGVWESAVKITDAGWVVEMKIPYSAIRFPAKAVQEWAFQINRNIRRNREVQKWCLTPSTASNGQNYWGLLDGIENIEPPLRLSLTPYMSLAYERQPTEDKTSNTYSYRGGADIKYGLDERFTLDMTLLPDFGQVQSDNKIKTLSYEEVMYDENRPFFKEATDIFSKDGLFYSRRIGQLPSGFFNVYNNLNANENIKNNPTESKLINATKISGRMDNGVGLGLFNAITNNTYATIENTETGLTRKVLTEPLTNYNVMVVDKQWKNNSSVYFINTNVTRGKGFSDSDVAGAGFDLVNKKKTYGAQGAFDLSMLFLSSPSGDFPKKQISGYRYNMRIGKTSGALRWGLSQTAQSPDYNPTDLGYYRTANRITTNAYATLFRFKPYKKVQEGNTQIGATYKNYFSNGDFMSLMFNNNTYVLFKSYNAIFGGGGFTPLSGHEYDPRLNGHYVKAMRYWWADIGVSTDYRKPLVLETTFNVSNFVDRFLSEGYNLDAMLRYRISDKLTVSASTSYYFDPYNFGFTDQTDNGYLFGLRRMNTYENKFSVRYIFKNDLSLSLVARHYWFSYKYRKFFDLEDNGDISPSTDDYGNNYNGSYNFFNADLLFNWRFAPGSTLTLSYKNIFDNGSTEILSYRKNFDTVFDNPHTHTLSLKVLYYLDFLQLRKKN